ncbi:MAG: ShlB/FhaC/HecB family hemolysin secretion/activation protein, partial [Rhodanobacter sp.]
KGYPLARAYIPAQRLSGGTVRIAVLEARYGLVKLVNHSRTSHRLLEATLAPLASGAPVTTPALDRSLLLLGDIPGVVIDSLLRPGERPGRSDLHVDVTDGPRYAGVLALDNFGSRYTGRVRLSGGLSVNGLLHHGDLLTASVLSSGSGVKYARLDYKYRLGGQGTVLGASASSLNYTLSGDLRDLDAHGTARMGSVYVSHPFIRGTRGNLYGQLEFDHRRLHDDIDIIGARTRRHTSGWTATLAGDARDAHGLTHVSVAATSGVLGFDNAMAEFVDSTSAQTRGRYVKWLVSVSRLQQLAPGDVLYVGLQSQWANRNLDSAEQLYLGGISNLRGYDTSIVAGAQGQVLNLELRHTLDVALPGVWVATTFADAGWVSIYKRRFAPGPNRTHMQDVGLGLRWSGAGQWSVNAALAHPVGGFPALAGPVQHGTRAWVQVQKGF